jgi:hypothetical protein
MNMYVGAQRASQHAVGFLRIEIGRGRKPALKRVTVAAV